MAKWILGIQFGRAETKWSTTFGKRGEQPVALLERWSAQKRSQQGVAEATSSICYSSARFFLGTYSPTYMVVT